uniref:Ig-like domain-containing protein n=1 Tax=Sphaeramia orbicularis TaxID=375764 RepID=A0A672ZPQ0_9TELE
MAIYFHFQWLIFGLFCCWSFCLVIVMFFSSALIEAADVPQSVSSIVVKLGDNVSLYCPASDEERVIYLYKQPLGRLMQTVAVGVYGKLTANELFNDPRFSVTKKDALVVFTIRNINKDDEATYFCKVGSFFHAMSFINGTFLAVEAASVQPGDPVTVQCSLPSEDKENTIQDPGEHSEHWFRSGEYQPGIIYTHRTRTEEPDKRKCIYSLSKTAQDSSNSGTYYCAVAACGQILFGGGTKVETDTIQRTDVSHPISPAVVELGDTVTFSCPVPATETYFYWHKQPLGCMIQTVAEGFYGQSVNDMFNNSRFLFTQNNSERVFTIINVTKEDEALYFCQSGSSYGQNFINSTFLTVTGKRSYFFYSIFTLLDRLETIRVSLATIYRIDVYCHCYRNNENPFSCSVSVLATNTKSAKRL